MTAQLAPYTHYRAPKVRWLGQVPAHWSEKRAKYFFREVDNRSASGEEELLSVSHLTGVTRRSQKNVTMFKAETYVGHKLCQPGDVVINTMWAWAAGLGVAEEEGIVSPSYGVYRPRVDSQFVPAYLDFLLRTKPFVAEYHTRSTGIRASRLRLYPDKFLDISFVRPPLGEQEQMVRFLRAKDLVVARYIRSKRELIKRLEEQADEYIGEAVTSGVNGSRPLRSAGAGWVEEIPADWKVGPLKRLARFGRKTFTDGDWIESPYITDSGIRLIQTGNVGVGRYREQGFRYISDETFHELRCTEVLPDDILICRLGEPVGRACLAPDLGCRMITSVDVCILRPRDDIHAPYVVRAMSARPYLDWVNSLVRGSTRDRVSRSMLGSFPFVAPPFDEQLRICEALDDRLRPIESAIACARDEITLVLECRDRLVADVVTGRLDVRTIAVTPTGEEGDPDLDDLLSIEELGSLEGADEEGSDADD